MQITVALAFVSATSTLKGNAAASPHPPKIRHCSEDQWITVTCASTVTPSEDKNSSGDEIANVNFYAVRAEATRIR